MRGIKGKTVIITGGTRGIGRACCLAFAKAQANIVFTYNKNKNLADELIQEMARLKAKSLAVMSDIRDYAQCRDVAQKAQDKFGRIDILINNAGITRDKPLFLMLAQDWKDVIDTNLNGTFNMSRALITTFLKQKSGCIINMSSVSGIAGIAGQSNYSASKAGIIGFSKSLAKEAAPHNIRVNVVCPGYIKTDMVDSLREDVKEKIKEQIPVKRMGEPEEVARMCLFLASDDSRYIIGQEIVIDGGLVM